MPQTHPQFISYHVTLSSASAVPLKWMEWILYSCAWKRTSKSTQNSVQKAIWHSQRVLNDSTIAAVHKLVQKLEFAILKSQSGDGTRNIPKRRRTEGALDDISFDAIEKAMDTYCKSRRVNLWIISKSLWKYMSLKFLF